MKKAIRVLTVAAFSWAVFMLLFYIFLIACVELQWTFLYNLPAAANWVFVNIFINLFRAGVVAVPVLAGGMLVLAVVFGVKQKSVKQLDIPLLGCTTVFGIAATMIGIIDVGTLDTFV